VSLATWFSAEIAAADGRLSGVSPDRAALPYRPGGWTRVEVLGHLIDSAINNHVRFAGAATNPRFEMLFGYEQNGWVRVHAYGEMPWADVLRHWRMQNQLLARVVGHVRPEQTLKAGDTEWAMEHWVRDYIRHLKHHVDQICS
jgi:hypothetical protein